MKNLLIECIEKIDEEIYSIENSNVITENSELIKLVSSENYYKFRAMLCNLKERLK